MYPALRTGVAARGPGLPSRTLHLSAARQQLAQEEGRRRSGRHLSSPSTRSASSPRAVTMAMGTSHGAGGARAAHRVAPGDRRATCVGFAYAAQTVRRTYDLSGWEGEALLGALHRVRTTPSRWRNRRLCAEPSAGRRRRCDGSGKPIETKPYETRISVDKPKWAARLRIRRHPLRVAKVDPTGRRPRGPRRVAESRAPSSRR